MLRLLTFLKPYRKNSYVGQFFKLLEAILELLIPTLMAYIIDIGIKNKDLPYILKIGGLMIFVAIIGVICAFICQYNAAIASQGFGTSVRNHLFSHIGSFSHTEIDKFGTASLINRITGDVNQLQLAVAMWIRLVVRAPFLCIGGIIMAMMINLKLSLIIFAILPLFLVVLYFIMSKSIPLYKIVQGKLDKIAIVTRESLSGVRVIRAFDRIEGDRERFEQAAKEHADTAVIVGKLSSLMNPATTLIMNLGIIAILWFGGIQVNIGQMTQGQVIAYLNYVIFILQALIVVANLVVIFTKASASAVRVNEVIETKGSVQDIVNPLQEDSASQSAIEFDHVYFRYKDAKDYALKDVHFTIKKGQTIGIIGGTGSGKSTLVNLIPRFYDASEGSIRVNGTQVNHYAQLNLREKIGIVPQKAVLFAGTIRDNILWGNKHATDEEIHEALDIAQASEFVNYHKDGIGRQISQGGANVSGGQKQRLTIARAIVKKPEILILDDSASALDYATDARLRKAIKTKTTGMTVVIVSQRVSTIKNADQIIVLENGEMVGLGTHEGLLQSSETYKEICLSQLTKEEVEAYEK